MLTEDVKWLAVTHKSYDHGRRGFNDRLAFLGMPRSTSSGQSRRRSNKLTWRVGVGKRLVDVHTTLALVHAAPDPLSAQATDQYGRVPFQHPALGGLQNVTLQAKARMGDKRRVSQLAQQYGLGDVVRWKPKKVSLVYFYSVRYGQNPLTRVLKPQATNLLGSGSEVVLAQALYAIVGAVALQRGGESAVTVVRERILQPLGLS